ncbi:MAG: elongation factor P [Clostridia bacterium]|nr:elongation factor P [Clostridia bacterium]MDD4685721.1 elongation factor P [Clostridia bacterium]
MLAAGSFRKGHTFEMEGSVYLVVDFLHVQPGRGSPFVRTKLKNIMTGQTLEKTFSPTEKFNIAEIEKKEMQYLYNDDNLYYFMDLETYEQIPLNKSQVEYVLNFITENMMANIQFYKNNPISVEPPLFVELTITKCDLGLQGDTAKASFKPATLETGFKINVPLFVNQGDKIKVDTRDGTYIERVK